MRWLHRRANQPDGGTLSIKYQIYIMNHILHRNVRRKQQLEDECGTAALWSAMDHFGIETRLEQLLSATPVGAPKWRDWLYFLGAYAEGVGLDTEVITLSTQTMDPTWRNVSSEMLTSKISEELSHIKRMAEGPRSQSDHDYYLEHNLAFEQWELMAAIKYLRGGGSILVQPLSEHELHRRLEHRELVIASVDASILYQGARVNRGLRSDVAGSAWGHVVLLTGCISGAFSYIDPARSSPTPTLWVPSNYLIEAVLRRDQNVLTIAGKDQCADPDG